MSRLGRNPFDKKPEPANSQQRAAEIVREMNQAAKVAESRAKIEPELKPSLLGRAARLVLVDLPAESYVLGVKVYCLSISILKHERE